jgi:hypothetical protein
MHMDEPWTAGAAGMSLDSWLVSFQRYARPVRDRILTTPSSLGALPVRPWEGTFLLPVGQNEAFWIGVTPSETTGFGKIELRGAHVGNGVERLPTHAMGSETRGAVASGWAQSDGSVEVFCVDTITCIFLSVRAHTAEVLLVDPKTFAARTGLEPPPLDCTAGYAGWRLP